MTGKPEKILAKLIANESLTVDSSVARGSHAVGGQ